MYASFLKHFFVFYSPLFRIYQFKKVWFRIIIIKVDLKSDVFSAWEIYSKVSFEAEKSRKGTIKLHRLYKFKGYAWKFDFPAETNIFAA